MKSDSIKLRGEKEGRSSIELGGEKKSVESLHQQPWDSKGGASFKPNRV